jgi:hypothetical protein
MNRDYEIKSEIEFEISKMQNMTLRGDVPVKYLLHKDTTKKSSNRPVEPPKVRRAPEQDYLIVILYFKTI